MTLLREFLNQISPIECFRALKQGGKELINQWSVREWTLAIFCYMPNATGKRVSGSVRTIPGGTPNEIHQALVQLQQSLKNQ